MSGKQSREATAPQSPVLRATRREFQAFADEIVAVARAQVEAMRADVNSVCAEGLRVIERLHEQQRRGDRDAELLRELYVAFAPCELPQSKQMRKRALDAAMAAKQHIVSQGWELHGDRWMRPDGVALTQAAAQPPESDSDVSA